MARIPTSLIRRARSINPLLVPLLRTCRDLASARNELRWLTEHVEERTSAASGPSNKRQNPRLKRLEVFRELRKLCIARGRGTPLQYLMGTTCFGELELQCHPGVLIPREDTARQVEELVRRLRVGLLLEMDHAPKHLRVLDLCTGSGCMALLFHHLARTQLGPEGTQKVDNFGPKIINRAAILEKNYRLYPEGNYPFAPGLVETFDVLGVDNDPSALALARLNADNVVPAERRHEIEFVQADVIHRRYRDKLQNQPSVPELMELLNARGKKEWDLLLANPPYISPRKFHSITTAGSVRNFEPSTALVPPDPLPTAKTIGSADNGDMQDADAIQADTFYQSLLDLALDVKIKVVLLEVGDREQAERVVQMARDIKFVPPGITHYKEVPFGSDQEIWCDDVGNLPDIYGQGRPYSTIPDKPGVKIFGEGEARCVVLKRGSGHTWIRDVPRWDSEMGQLV